MRMTKLATVVSVLMLGAAAQAGDYKMTKEQFTAADKDRDGSLTLAEAQASAPKFAEKFAKIDANGDGKVSVDELNAHTKAGDKSMESDQATTPPSDE
jgi:Ca2+-binding EF-hand superfamily protein